MITVSCPIKQEFVIEVLDGKTIDGIKYTFEGKSGINLKFSISPENKEEAIAIAKKTIKATEVGSVLYFQIV